MKLNKIIAHFRLETAFFRICAAAAVIMLTVDHIDAIRVYEGTNIPAPVPKLSKAVGFSKKSLYISKRSWTSADEKLSKTDRRSAEGKWKDIARRTETDGAPTLYKIKFTDKNYMQYIRYIKEIPRLEEYTFCMWYKSENMSHDQTLFTYSLNKNELLLRFWINAFDSTLRMAIRENLVFKVPANIRENKWHHICQSWNGVLGEWQVFLDGKRIGAGVLPHYKGTYIPGMGEVTLGQELIGLNKRLNDGMDGEIFGFNLVDEAIPLDQGIFINNQYRPNVQIGVPPFKKLPPIKKSYQEIKAYISSLPSDPSEARKKNEGFPGEMQNAIKKSKENYSVPPKRIRGNHRLRYPPLRKVVVYNRDDRQLFLEEALIELNKTKPLLPPQNLTVNHEFYNKKETRPLDVNYSIHSYRSKKNERKPNNYEIHEVFEDDGVKEVGEDEITNKQFLERRARQNFNLFIARQANKVYTLSNSVKDFKKPQFHFETRTEASEKSNRRSFEVEETRMKAARKLAESVTKKAISDAIPVYEPETNPERKKRSSDEREDSGQFAEGNYKHFMKKQMSLPNTNRRLFLSPPDIPHTDSNGFRRLPQIPESFINIFTQNASRSEMEEKLDEFFKKSNSTEKTNVVAEIPETPKTSPVKIEDKIMISLPVPNDAQFDHLTTGSPIPSFSPIPEEHPRGEGFPEMKSQLTYVTGLGNPGPVSFPKVQDFSLTLTDENKTPLKYGKSAQTQEGVLERRRFDVSSGTDLVMRSYGECTAERGSPVRDKEHLVVSWADTPVRIFGGAQVEAARNQCGYF